ncbi:glycoside hydrolase family 36 protein [Microbacterium sp. G2-8]|uniref:glycoside hydrolase family 36 protein n=1 Tax=Microbacterium sp. G2-8 TaxID=2842454 RepID=UPI001C8A0F8A|nr:glycoside hydrolase family 36 protein [Microbacterium sp. G2-8]
MITVHEMSITPEARIYAEGWQSWSPTTWFGPVDPAHRPAEEWQRLMRFRPDSPLPDEGYQAEGLLVVDAGDGSAPLVCGSLDASRDVPSIRATPQGDRLRIDASAPVEIWQLDEFASAPDPRRRALEWFGERFGRENGARASAPDPRVWCTWYQYFEEVTAADVRENLAEIERLGLDVDVVQIDDGWSLGTGEWMRPNPRFGSLPDAVSAIRDSGRRAGIWAAPFAVGSQSDIARTHPEWLTGPAGYNWGDHLVGLDLTHPGVQGYLTDTFSELRDLGIDYVKLDFLYAGAVAATRYDADATPVSAYRTGLQLIRDVFGDDGFLLACGAPILPSVGIVDAMRVSPDTFHEGGEDGSQGLRGRMSMQARRWQHGRLWTNDPDCLVARPEFVLRDEWADVVLSEPGIRGSSDRLSALDEHGRQLVRQLLGGAR